MANFSTKVKMECNECGKVFWKNVGYGTVEAKCPTIWEETP
jgi:phage FluMu protein Com